MKALPRLLLASCLAAAATVHAAQPNIILILADDVGWSDLGCFGSEIPTPNLDALAAGGLRFTQFYNTARCCPTRASLITGLYPHQAGVGHMVDVQATVSGDGYAGELNKRSVTIAEALQPAHYRTYMCGKWHLTPNTGPNGPKDTWPLQRGFDRYYGTVNGAGSFFDPPTLVRDNTMITAGADPEYKSDKYYYTDALADQAVRFTREHKKDHADQPFFLYLAFTAAHWPLQAPEEEISKHKGKYDAGYEAIRAARWEKQKKLGLIDPSWPLTPAPASWSSVPDKAWEARCMEVYAAQITRMDTGIGRLVASLREQGQLENTLIFFLQDNGACAEPIGRNGTPAAKKAKFTPRQMGPNDFFLNIIPAQTRDGRPMRNGPETLPGADDTYIAYGRTWANVSNTPFREYKHWVHEGGISTPLIVSWPAGIPAKGELRTQPGHLIDIMATCVDVAGATYPAQLKGNPVTPMEGRSLRPAFQNKPIEREALYWEHEGNRAIRIGNWKLVAKGPAGVWELYDMAKNRPETEDLANKEPDRVNAMRTQWETWAKRTSVLPWVWKPAYGEQAVGGEKQSADE